MSPAYLMALDAGGRGGCCLLVEIESGQAVSALRPWRHRVVPGTGGWGFDLDLERCWSLLAEAAHEAMRRAGAAAEDVIGLAATSMRHTTIVLDAEGRAILATPNRDARAASEAVFLATEHGNEFHQRTGHWPNPIFAAARLRWLTANARDAWEHAALFLSLGDWITYRLCGEAVTDPSQAGETLLLDLETGKWASDLIQQLDLPGELFPPVSQAGARLGNLTGEAAAVFGLKPGTPVAVGGADTQCGLLGAGIVAPGKVGAIAGSTAPLQFVLDQPTLDPQARMWTGHHVVPGRWVMESNAGAMGGALEWFAGIAYPDAGHPLIQFAGDAAKSQPGAAGIVSTIGAEVMNATNMSLPVGNLTLTHLTAAEDSGRRHHVARAILEGLAFALRANLHQILSVVGGEQPELWLAGGMSRSPLWTQIVSDVLDAPVTVPATPEATALGATICAGVAAGVFDDLAEGAQALVRAGRQHTPDPASARLYDDLYAGWQELREARGRANDLASGIALQGIMRTAPAGPPPGKPLFRPRILVTADIDDTGLAALRALAEVGCTSYREAMRLLAGPDLVEALAGYHALVTEVDVVDVDALQQLPELRVIVACRGHAVNVDVAACTALGIPVLHAPGRNADAVADLTLAFMLMLSRRIPEAAAFLREPGSEEGDVARMGQAHRRLQGHELWRKTVGLVGLGAVGRAVARRLRPFQPRILVHDPFIPPEDVFLAGAEPASLDTILEESDVLSLHAAVSDASRGLIGAEELARMKPGAFLINTARAALVDEDALLEALRSGHLGGAALDVFSVEPPGADHPLLVLPNVIATPHVGGNTFEVAAHQGLLIAEDLERMVRGEKPRHVLNPGTLDAFRWEGKRAPISPQLLTELARQPPPAVTDLEQTARPAPEAEPFFVPAQRGDTPPPQVPAGTGAGPQMERLLRAFIARAVGDPGLAAFARGQPVTMHYVLRDLGLEFYTRFHEGTVTGGMGAPPEPAEVRLKMRAEVLDGMFTGRVNPTQAAMEGQLSFSGDTRLAMGLQRMQDDLSRVYNLAREEVRGPGDLPTEEPVAARPALATPSPRQALQQELLQALNELYAVGCITATGGNVSVRIPGASQVWITPSQVHKGDLRPHHLVRIDLRGHVLDADAPAPSSEWPMHCAVYQARPDVGAIIHAHAPQATTLGLAGLPFLPISTEAAFLGDLPRVPFIMPGTQELAHSVAQALGDGPAVLLQNHGLLVAASSLRRATDLVEIIERTAEVILGCYAVGKEPPTLPEDVVAQLREVGKMMA